MANLCDEFALNRKQRRQVSKIMRLRGISEKAAIEILFGSDKI